jgi:hypothetical protein
MHVMFLLLQQAGNFAVRASLAAELWILSSRVRHIFNAYMLC